MKRVIFIVCILALVGCTTFMAGCAEYRAIAGSRGQEASDATLHDALWVLCNAVPVGAVKRRFNTIEKLVAYNSICEDESKIQI